MSSRHLLPFRRTAVVIGALLFVAGCTMPQKDQKPAASQPAPQAETSAANQPAVVETAPAPAAPAPEIVGTTVFEPPSVSNMRPTGTVVGQKIGSLRDDLLKLQGQLKAENDQLQSLRISARQFAGNHLHQCRFSSAVTPYKANPFARLNGKIQSIQ